MSLQVEYIKGDVFLKKCIQCLFTLAIALASARSGHAQVRFSRTNAQRERYFHKRLYLLGGIEFSGLPYNYKFQQQGNILQRNWAFPDGTLASGFGLSLSIAIHYRISKRFAIETGLQFSEMDLIVNDKSFMRKIGIKGTDPQDNITGTVSNKGNFDAANWYRSNYVSGYYFVPSRTRTNLYFSGGVAINYLMGPTTMTGSFYYQPTKDNLELSTHYKSVYLSSFIETGIYIHPQYDLGQRNGPVYFIGMKYYFAGNIISGDYQNTQNGNVDYQDHVDSDGSYLSLTFKMGGLLSKEGKIRESTYSGRHHKSKIKSKKFSPSHHQLKSKKNSKPVLKENESNTRGF